jgi:hypothetical protein
MILDMFPRPLRSITAGLLIVLLGILHSGVPSHNHETDTPAAAHDGVQLSAHTHYHGVILLDAAERVPATSAEFSVPAVRLEATPAPTHDRRASHFDAAPLRPSERGPPPAAPRAPPHFV